MMHLINTAFEKQVFHIFYFFLNPSEFFLFFFFSPYSPATESNTKVMKIQEKIAHQTSSWLLNKVLLVNTIKCVGNCIKNMHNDVRV